MHGTYCSTLGFQCEISIQQSDIIGSGEFIIWVQFKVISFAMFIKYILYHSALCFREFNCSEHALQKILYIKIGGLFKQKFSVLNSCSIIKYVGSKQLLSKICLKNDYREILVFVFFAYVVSQRNKYWTNQNQF